MKGVLLGPEGIPKATETPRAAARGGPRSPAMQLHNVWVAQGEQVSHLPPWGWKPGRPGAQRPCPGSCPGSSACSALGVRSRFRSVGEREGNRPP